MKRHLLILSPVLFFVAIVGCGGGDDKPAPPLASNKQTTPEILCASHRLDDAFKKCQSGIGDILPLLLQGQQSGNNPQNMALIAAALSKPNKNPAPPPVQIGPGGLACAQPQVDSSTSCNDDLKTALVLWTSAPKKDGSLAINDPFYKNALYLQMKAKFAMAAQQMGLNPQQQLIMAAQLQSSFNNSPLAGTLGANSSLINSYLPPTTAAYTPAANTTYNSALNSGLNSGTSLGLGFNSATTGTGTSAPTAGQSMHLSLNPASRATTTSAVKSFTVEDSAKPAASTTRQMVDMSELAKARGIGLPARSPSSSN
jgi:hypothetical protein